MIRMWSFSVYLALVVLVQANSREKRARGTAGQDYPDFKKIPQTSFKCSDYPYGGYYADVSTGCQVYHICHGTRKESILCPPTTVFNQYIRSCDHWHNVECDQSEKFFYLNADIANETPKGDSYFSGGSHQGRYFRRF